MPGQRRDDNNKKTLARLRELLVQAGIPVGAFHDILDRAIRLNFTDSEFILGVYGTHQFKAMFPGIFRKDGSLRMTPYEYRQLEDQYNSAARIYGIGNLSKDHIGKLIRGDVSIQEFTDRATAIQRVNEFRPAFEEFKQIANARGIKTKGIDTDKERIKFMLGQGPKQFYQLWDELTVGTAARTAGFDVSQGLIKSIAKRVPGQADELQMQTRFADLAKQARTLMPLSQLGRYGLSSSDLVTLEFGGPNQAAIADKVDTIIKNRDAFASTKGARTVGPQSKPQY